MFLVVGGDSEIGAAAATHLRRSGQPVLQTTRRPTLLGADRLALDLAGDLSHWAPPPGITAACICAAVARLADCAADPARSAATNVTGTLMLAERLVAHGVYVLFLSTNQVFDGSTPHVQADAPTNPVSEYGKQKARTEAALCEPMRQGAPVAILRLAKVVSRQTALLRDWSTALAAGRPIRAFHDMTMAPTPIDAVARAIEALMSDRAPGVFQLTGPRDVTYTEVGLFLAKRLAADPALVMRASVKDAGLPPGIGPAHTTLDSTALRQRYGIVMQEPWEVLGAALSETDPR